MSAIKIEVDLPVNPNHAWEFYFNQINNWCPPTFFTSPNTKRFVFETFLGGRIYEDFGEGDGLVWAHVIGAEYPHSLDMRGNLTRAFGGPAVTYERLQFDKKEGGSKLTYTMDFVGEIGEKGIQSLRDGWTTLFNESFLKYCEERKT